MAIWQFDFLIIPSSENDVIEDDDKLWKRQDINDQAIYIISKYLRPAKSWTNEIELFGITDSTCIEFCNYEDQTSEILCRLDLRNLSKELFEKLVNFVTLLGGMIYYNNTAYLINQKTLLELITNSSNAKFCIDPVKFLDDI